MTDSVSLCIFPSIYALSALHWQCVWGHCHAEKLSCCQSDAFPKALHGGSKSDHTFLNS